MHTDKAHIHNHIGINATAYKKSRKYLFSKEGL
ncbi:relaxase/mobilization nuclease domain-containing protein [Priestia megaterium]